jgi:antitoxin (DNA-binding transcriptional repressor) of toxin-antitoxin stability system
VKRLEVAQATGSLAEYVDSVGREPLILTMAGKPVAALVAIDADDLESAALSVHPQFLAILERSRLRHERGGISTDEMRQQLGLRSNGTTES